MAHTIRIGITGKVARQTDKTVYVCGNSDYTIVFDFDAEWAQHDVKTARFVHGVSYVDVVFQGNVCAMPIITDTHSIKVGVFAGDLRTSTPATISAKKSILDEHGTPAAPSDDVYNQIMGMVDEAAKASDSAVKQAGASAAQAAESASQSATIKGEIVTEEAARQKAEAARVQAEKERSTAEGKRTSAESARTTAEQARQPAETSRDTAEKARASAEEARAKAEAQRAETFAGYAKEMELLHPDDTVAGGRTWSSKHLVDTLCPSFEAHGNPVQVHPVPGYPLGIVASWEPRQEGSGTPSPDNVRPILGKSEIRLFTTGENLTNFPNQENQTLVETYYKDSLVMENVLPDATYTLQFTGVSSVAGWFAAVLLGKNAAAKDVGNSQVSTIAGKMVVTLSFSVTTEQIAQYGNNLFFRPVRYKEKTTATYSVYDVSIVVGTSAPAAYSSYSGSKQTLALPRAIAGGSVNAETGEGQEEITILSLPIAKMGNSDDFHGWENTSPELDELQAIVGAGVNTSDDDTIGFVASNVVGRVGAIGINTVGSNRVVFLRKAVFGLTSDEWKAQYPDLVVQIALRRKTPIPFTATGGAETPALAGVNTITTDGSSVTVTGRADPIREMQNLTARVAALEGVTNS